MLLRNLFESETKHITFVFGRMNPPTIGHKQLLDTAKSVGGDYKIFLSQSQDRKKNPLDYPTKIKFVKAMFPEHAQHIIEDAGLNTVGKVASRLYDLGYRSATIVAGSDRLDDMYKLLKDYNGVEGKAHGYYKFDVLDAKSSGDREDGAEGVAGISASGARAAAANNNFKEFQEATGAGQYAKKLFDAVRKGMGINESIEEVSLVNKLKWPEVVNKVNSAMKATGWKGGRKGDDAYIFSTKGQETDDQYYFVIIENTGKGYFTYALGTVEDGDPYIDDSYKGRLPNTEASVSELINMIRDGFGLGEARRANTSSARAEFGKRPRAELSDKEKEKEKADSDAAWERLMAYAAQQKKDQDVEEGNLKEFTPSGNSSSSYYAVTSNFVKEFVQQKQEELQDLIDAGWTKKDLAQAGTLKGQAADIEHFEQVRDGFLKGLKPGFDAYLQGDTQLKDQLGAYWLENDLPLNQDWEKIYGEPWGDDGEFEDIAEAPIEMDPSEPMNPMIHSHNKANPGKLKYRMLRAASQLKDLAARAENASPGEWQIMARQFEELKMNMEQIRHALEELGKLRKKGGVRSRGIDPMLDDINEGYGRYYCSTDKKWKTRKGPKQSRKSK